MEALRSGEVHVWIVGPDSDGGRSADFEALLDPTERTAAHRFVFERHRMRYIFAHGLLRQILSLYVDLAPEEMRFECNRFGKPRLAGPDEAGRLQFNLSHSGDAVAVAVTSGRHIGADIECIRPLNDFPAIAKRHFTRHECAMIESRAPAQRQMAFFTCWTRKEAFIKAVGKGLSMPLNTFDASIPDGSSGRRIVAPQEAPDVRSWWVADLDTPEGYVGAVVIEEGFEQLTYRTWRLPRPPSTGTGT